MDVKSGEMTAPRKSPRTGRVYDALYELYHLREFWGAQGVAFEILLIDMQEYRLLDGWGRGGKRGSHRAERYPVRIFARYTLRKREDFLCFLPSALPDRFTAVDYRKETHLSEKKAGLAVKCLCDTGFLSRAKEGRAYVYHRCMYGT